MSFIELIKQFIQTKDTDILDLLMSTKSQLVIEYLWLECLQDLEALEILLQEESLDPSHNNCELLWYAVKVPDALKLLLEDERMDPCSRDSECLFEAAEWDADSVKLLLEDGRVDPTLRDSECLRVAAEHDSDCLRVILEDGRADPGAKNSMCLGISIQHNFECFVLLLQDGRVITEMQDRLESTSQVSFQILADTTET